MVMHRVPYIVMLVASDPVRFRLTLARCLPRAVASFLLAGGPDDYSCERRLDRQPGAVEPGFWTAPRKGAFSQIRMARDHLFTV